MRPSKTNGVLAADAVVGQHVATAPAPGAVDPVHGFARGGTFVHPRVLVDQPLLRAASSFVLGGIEHFQGQFGNVNAQVVRVVDVAGGGRAGGGNAGGGDAVLFFVVDTFQGHGSILFGAGGQGFGFLTTFGRKHGGRGGNGCRGANGGPTRRRAALVSTAIETFAGAKVQSRRGGF